MINSCPLHYYLEHVSIGYIFIISVPVTTVSFSSSSGSSITVSENSQRQFECRTSEERPRSTIQWYISGNAASLGTGDITPTDHDALGTTVSTLTYSFNRAYSNRQLHCTAFNIPGQTPVESTNMTIIVECKFLCFS